MQLKIDLPSTAALDYLLFIVRAHFLCYIVIKNQLLSIIHIRVYYVSTYFEIYYTYIDIIFNLNREITACLL